MAPKFKYTSDKDANSNNWLTDIFNMTDDMGSREAVCTVCRIRKTNNPNDIFPIWDRGYVPQTERMIQDEEEFEMTLQTGGPFDEQSKHYQGT